MLPEEAKLQREQVGATQEGEVDGSGKSEPSIDFKSLSQEEQMHLKLLSSIGGLMTGQDDADEDLEREVLARMMANPSAEGHEASL